MDHWTYDVGEQHQVTEFGEGSRSADLGPAAVRAADDLYFRVNTTQQEIGEAALHGGAWVLLAQGLVMFVRVASSIILARLLMPTDFGLYAMMVGALGASLIFMDLGLCDAIIRWPNLTNEQVSSLFWVNLATNCAFVLCLGAFSPVLGRFFREPRLVGMVWVWSLTIFFGALSAQHLALMKRAMLFADVSKLTVTAALVSNIAAVALAWKGAAYWALILREVSNQALLAIGAWALCPWRPQRFQLSSQIKPMLLFGLHSMTSFIVKRTGRNLDRTLLGWRYGAAVTGFYHNAFELAAMFTSLIADPLRNVAVSGLSKLRDQPDQIRLQFLKVMHLVAFVSFAVTAILAAAGGDIVSVFLGPKWISSGHILRILGLSTGVSILSASSFWLHFSLGRGERMIRWTIAEAVVVGAAVLAGLGYGSEGVAWGYCAAAYILCVTAIWYAGHPVGLTFRDTTAVMSRPAVASAIAGFGCWHVLLAAGLNRPSFLRLIAFCVLFCPVYVKTIILLGGGTETVKTTMQITKMFVSGHRRGGSSGDSASQAPGEAAG